MTAQVPNGAPHLDPVAALVSTLRAAGGTAALCGFCHALMPAMSGVGLTVSTRADQRFVLGTSGLLIDQIEDLQITLNEGPCMAAVGDRTPVLVDDLAGTDAALRWPVFTARARGLGVAAIFAFPVLLLDRPVAILDLCRTTPGPMPEHDRASALLYAQAAAILLTDDITGLGGDGAAAVPLAAAQTQQAIGMVVGQAAVDATVALHRLRSHALDHDLPLADVVGQVLAGRLRFDPTPGR